MAVGELVELFAEVMPLHHAARIWISQRGGSDQLSNPMRMRRFTLLKEARLYPLAWRPALLPRQPITDTQVLVPQGRACAGCGGVYFAQKPARFCGPSCARKSYWQARGPGGRYAAVPVGGGV